MARLAMMAVRFGPLAANYTMQNSDAVAQPFEASAFSPDRTIKNPFYYRRSNGPLFVYIIKL